MIFNSKIFFKNGRSPLVVSHATALEVDKNFKDPYVDGEQIIEAGGMSFRKAQINGVSPVRDTPEPQDGGSGDYQKKLEDERLYRQAWLKNPKRHEQLFFFEFLVEGVCRKTVTPEMRAQAIEIQRAFFAKNPNRCYCDPTEFLAAFPDLKRSSISHIQDAGLRVVESVVQNDIRQSRFHA